MKRLILALIILLTPILSLITITSSNETASAGTLAGWNYRKSITIDHTNDGNQSNYQMMLTLNKSSGVDSTGLIYLENHTLNWPTDIYFTTSDGTTGADFWRESNTSTQGVWWVEADTILNGSTWTGYIYYGDADAADASNGSNTFPILFDHFANLDAWTVGAGTWVAESFDSKDCAHLHTDSWPSTLYKDIALATGYKIITAVRSNTADTWGGILYRYGDQNNFFSSKLSIQRWNVQGINRRLTGTWTSRAEEAFTCNKDIWYYHQVTVSGNVHNVKTNSTSISAYTDTNLTANTKIGLHPETAPVWFDYIAVAKFTTNEPTWAASGAEENLISISVTTQAATLVEETTCTGNGNITSVNTSAYPSVRGFCYMVGVAGDPTTANTTAFDAGNYSTGAYTKAITGLTAGTSYRLRAYIIDANGTYYGSTVQVLTKPTAPTNVAASDGTSTTNVTVTWTKSTGATGYYVFEGSNLLDTLGDVATYNDSNAPAPALTNGSATASDGTQVYVVLTTTGQSATNGSPRTYKVKAFNGTGNSSDSATDDGFRGITTITYAWQVSAADSDSSYSPIAGGTTNPYNYTSAPTNGDGRYYKCNISMSGATTVYTNSDRGYRIGLPTVTTVAATSISFTTARVNGNLTFDGWTTCNVSFQYAMWNGTAWVGNTSTANQTGIVTGNTFFANLTGLTVNTTYTFRAEATNIAGSGNGSWLNFTTLNLGGPSYLTCYAESNTVDLSWAKGVNADNTYIRWKIDSYPTGLTDGNLIGNISGYSYTHTGLLSGTSYYYRLWGVNGSEYSSLNATTMCSATAGVVSGTVAPLPTTDTSGWSESPNGSALVNNPLYSLGNQEADAIAMPHSTWWFLLGMGFLVVAGLFVFTRTENLLLAVSVVIVFGSVMATQLLIVPLWTIIIFGFASLGISWKELR